MIRVKNLTPEVYYNKSRDFQYIGRIFDVVINYIQTNTNNIYNIPLSKNMDKRYLDLLALTLGLKLEHNYNLEQLYAVCTVFEEALRNKGNLKSIQLITDALLKLQNSESTMVPEFDAATSTLKLYLPLSLQDNQLLNDLLDYIIPAGVRCNIFTYVESKGSATSEFKETDAVSSHKKTSNATSFIPKYADIIGETPDTETGISNLSGGGRDDNSVVIPYTNPNEGE